MRALAALFLVFGLVVGALPAVAGQPDPAPQVRAPQRIVSGGGDITEIVHALGAGARVIAVDSTSTWPEETADKAQIGYIRRLAAEGILSLEADMFLAAHDAGPPAAIRQMRAAGLDVRLAPRGDSPEGVLAKIRFVAAALGLEAEGEALARRIGHDMQAALEGVRKGSGGARVLFVLSERDGAPLVAGRDTAADAIITLAGGINAAGDFSGYKPMSREAVINAAPEMLLMMSETVARLGGIGTILERPGFALTPAGREGRYLAMEGMLLLGFGPRVAEAVRALSAAFSDD